MANFSLKSKQKDTLYSDYRQPESVTVRSFNSDYIILTARLTRTPRYRLLHPPRPTLLSNLAHLYREYNILSYLSVCLPWSKHFERPYNINYVIINLYLSRAASSINEYIQLDTLETFTLVLDFGFQV